MDAAGTTFEDFILSTKRRKRSPGSQKTTRWKPTLSTEQTTCKESGENTMKEIVWQEFNKSDRIVTKRKSFKTSEAMEKFIAKLTEKDNFYTILATR